MASKNILIGLSLGILYTLFEKLRKSAQQIALPYINLKQQFESAKPDSYQCLHLEMGENDTISCEKDFQKELRNKISIEISKKQNKGIWLKLHLNNMWLTEASLRAGFTVHHSKEEYILLTYWLQKEVNCNLPQYARHTIGAGGVIVSKKNQAIFLVQQGSGDRKGLWGLPGGHVDQYEQIADAAVRESFEETGLKTRCVQLFGIQGYFPHQWNTESIYFIYIMELLDEEQGQAIIDMKEISQGKWVQIDQLENFFQNQRVTHSNYLIRVQDYFENYYLKGKQWSSQDHSKLVTETGTANKHTEFFFNREN